MKPFFFLILLTILSINTRAQTTITFAGSAGTMLVSPEIFSISNPPLGLGGNMRVSWKGQYNDGHKFFEGGFEGFRFRTSASSKNYDWNYLRLNFGKRVYTIAEDFGLFVDIAAGFYGVLPSGFGSKVDKLHPGAGAFFGIGYAQGLIDVGFQIHVSISGYGTAVTPLFRLGLNISQ